VASAPKRAVKTWHARPVFFNTTPLPQLLPCSSQPSSHLWCTPCVLCMHLLWFVMLLLLRVPCLSPGRFQETTSCRRRRARTSRSRTRSPSTAAGRPLRDGHVDARPALTRRERGGAFHDVCCSPSQVAGRPVGAFRAAGAPRKPGTCADNRQSCGARGRVGAGGDGAGDAFLPRVWA